MDTRSVIYGAAVPTVAFAVGLAANLIPKDQIAIVLGASVFLSAIIAFFDLVLVRSVVSRGRFLEDVESRVARSLDQLQDVSVAVAQERLIISTEMQIKMEQSAQQVWVITEDFHWDTDSPVFSSVVDKRIRDGAEYRYFYPNTANGRKFSDRMGLKYGDFENVVLYPLDEKIFLLLQHEIVVYDADDPLKRVCIMADVNFKRRTDESSSKHLFVNRPDALPEIISNVRRWIDAASARNRV